MMSGRPTKPVVHWLSRPGGGWSEVEEIDAEQEAAPAEAAAAEAAPAEAAEESKEESPPRRLGYGRRPARIPATTAR
jgi:hypothetical protein